MPGRGNNTSATSSQDPAPQRRPCAPPPGQKRGSGLIAAGFLNADDGSDDEGERGEPNELRLIVSAARGLTAADAGLVFYGAVEIACAALAAGFSGVGSDLSSVAATLDPVANAASPEVFGRGLVTGTGRVNEAVSQPITEKASGTQLRG